jgi:surface antigen
MIKDKRLILIATLIVLSGCTTRPGEFDARLASLPADGETYLRDFATCRLLVRSLFQKNTGQQAATAIAAYPTVFVGGFIAAKMIKTDREKRQNAKMTECLQKYGYSVVGWDRVGKKNLSKTSVTPVAIAQTEQAAVQSQTVKEPNQ